MTAGADDTRAQRIAIHRCPECGCIEGEHPQAGCCPGCGIASDPERLEVVLAARVEELERERNEARAAGERFSQSMYELENRVLELRPLEARLRTAQEAAKAAKSIAAAPDYDEFALKGALWAVVAVALCEEPTQ